jgi:RimJ/RimL family protein N-acetyltransferase
VPVPLDQAARLLDGRPMTLPTAPDYPHDDSLDALRGAVEAGTPHGTFLVHLDGVVVGDCGWHAPPDEAGVVEIGYGLARSARGQGVGTAAVQQLLDRVAAEPGVTAVVATTTVANVASRRLLERVGFVLASIADATVTYRLALPPP